MVVAPLREAATEVVAAATVAESTRSIQLILLNRDGQAGSTLLLAQFRPSFGSPHLSLLSFPQRTVRISVRRESRNIVLCLAPVGWLLLYRYSLTGCAASPAGKCNLAQHPGREGVPPWFSFAGESQRRKVLTARSHRLCRSALSICDFT